MPVTWRHGDGKPAPCRPPCDDARADSLLAAPAATSGAAAAEMTPGVSSGGRAPVEGAHRAPGHEGAAGHHKEGHGHHKAFHPMGASAQQPQPLAGGAAAGALAGAAARPGGPRAGAPSAAAWLAGATAPVLAPGKALPPSKVRRAASLPPC